LGLKKNYRVWIAVPLAEIILVPTGIGLRLDLRYSDERTLAVPRFVEIMVLSGSEAIFSSRYVVKSSPDQFGRPISS